MGKSGCTRTTNLAEHLPHVLVVILVQEEDALSVCACLCILLEGHYKTSQPMLVTRRGRKSGGGAMSKSFEGSDQARTSIRVHHVHGAIANSTKEHTNYALVASGSKTCIVVNGGEEHERVNDDRFGQSVNLRHLRCG